MLVDPDPNLGDSTRRAFLRLAAAAGLFEVAGTACRVPDLQDPATTAAPPPEGLGRDVVTRGLIGLANAHERGWVSGHGGAALLAAHFFACDNRLDERTLRALRAQIDAFVVSQPTQLADTDPGRGSAPTTRIGDTLAAQIAELRGGGHGVIYASLALRALAGFPDLATPKVVDGLCKVLQQVANARLQRDTPHNREHPLPAYDSPRAIAEITLRAALRPWNDVRRVGASGVLHWLTHADAVLTLAELGHGELARAGHDAHRLHINGDAATTGGTPPPTAAVEWLEPAYWEGDAPRELFRGTWLAGHAFKLPYSLFRLLRATPDAELRAASLLRASHLLVPFAS